MNVFIYKVWLYIYTQRGVYSTNTLVVTHSTWCSLWL